MMSGIEIITFEPGIGIPAPIEVWRAVGALLRANYPIAHSTDTKIGDLALFSGEALEQRRTTDGGLLYIAHNGDVANPVGFLDSASHFIETEEPPVQVRHMRWIVVDEQVRGQGVSRALHDAYIDDVSGRLRVPDVYNVASLNVHRDNPARVIYEKWGYSQRTDMELSNKDMIFMTRAL